MLTREVRIFVFPRAFIQEIERKSYMSGSVCYKYVRKNKRKVLNLQPKWANHLTVHNNQL